MATERVTVHTGDDGDCRNAYWLELDGVYLLGRLHPESHAQKLAARLNAATDNTAADRMWDVCVETEVWLRGEAIADPSKDAAGTIGAVASKLVSVIAAYDKARKT